MCVLSYGRGTEVWNPCVVIEDRSPLLLCDAPVSRPSAIGRNTNSVPNVQVRTGEAHEHTEMCTAEYGI